MSNNIEVRYNDEKLRYFRLEPSGEGKLNVQLSLGWAPKGSPYSKQVKEWGIYETILVSGSSDRAREQWYWNLTKEQVREKLLNWRKKCTKEGLVNCALTSGFGK